MKKETIICIIIVITISVGNIITQKYTKESVETLSNDLEILKTELKNKLDDNEKESNKEILEKICKIKENWESRHDKLAYYIEHNELEKVENSLTALDSFVQTKEYVDAIKELDESVFVLRHIQEKYAFNLKNIF